MQIECWRGYPECVNILQLGCLLLQQTAHVPCCCLWQFVWCCRTVGSSAEAAHMDTTAHKRGRDRRQGSAWTSLHGAAGSSPIYSLTEQVKQCSSTSTCIQYLSPSQTPLAKCCLHKNPQCKRPDGSGMLPARSCLVNYSQLNSSSVIRSWEGSSGESCHSFWPLQL